MKRLTSKASIVNTKPLMDKIYSYYKRRDETYRSKTARLINQIYFISRRRCGNRIVISNFKDVRRCEDIIFPSGFDIVLYPSRRRVS